MAEARRTRTQTPLQQHQAAWAAGYGAVRHTSETQRRIAALAKRLHDAGVLTVPSGAQVVRFLPALNLTRAEAAEGVSIIAGVVKAVA